jgi:hypothetical protein
MDQVIACFEFNPTYKTKKKKEIVDLIMSRLQPDLSWGKESPKLFADLCLMFVCLRRREPVVTCSVIVYRFS